MKKHIAFSCIVSCLFFGAMQSKASSVCNAVAGNLVSNCGFEDGDFTSWTVSGNDVPGEEGSLYGVEAGADPTDGISPNSGADQAFFADLDSNATTLAQTFATTAGSVYAITFYAAQDTASSAEYGNELIASFGGTSLLDDSDIAAEGYTKYTFDVDATSASSTLDLTFGNGLGEFLLDDVSVVDTTPAATPEPSSWLLLGTGLLAMAGMARRRLGSR
jgi:Protein of unknown function (DUF642)/PEP-CTERM motif